MKEVINHETYGEIVYEESFWLGKKTITVNGVKAKMLSKKEFLLGEKRIFLTGDFLSGVKAQIDGQTVVITKAPKWYEIVLAIIPIILVLVWGNSTALCSIIPIVGGALGGAIGGIGGVLSLVYMKNEKRPLIKLLIGLLGIALTFILSYVVYIVILVLFA